MKIALIGYGKMGKAIEAVAIENGHEIVLAIDLHNQEQFTAENLKKAEVAIEFTSPETALKNTLTCLRAGIPTVVGSTGWHHHLPEAEKTCAEFGAALLVATNFSIGVNIFFEINRQLAKMMSAHPQYEVSMEEVHHTQKKDAPSGTAITLAEGILENLDRKKQWVNEPSSSSEELAIISKRIDPAPGTHIVRYESEIDTIEITHTAHNRKGFASGAVLAAAFLAGKKGVFSMRDVLGF